MSTDARTPEEKEGALLPCPFCGSEDVLLNVGRDSRYVHCSDCGTDGSWFQDIDACNGGSHG